MQTRMVFSMVVMLSAPSCLADFDCLPPTTCDPVIAAAGDIGVNGSEGQKLTGDYIRARSSVARVLALGDIAYGGGHKDDFDTWYDPFWGSFKGMTEPVPGNHDFEDRSQGEAHAPYYFTYFGHRVIDPNKGKGSYSYDIGSWHFVALNQYDHNEDSLPFLRNDLPENKKKWCTVVYWHEPLFDGGCLPTDQDSSKQYLDCKKDPNQEKCLTNRELREGSRERTHSKAIRVDGKESTDCKSRSSGAGYPPDAYWDELSRQGVDVVLNGHVHSYERWAVERFRNDGTVDITGIRQFTVGTGGRMDGDELPVSKIEDKLEDGSRLVANREDFLTAKESVGLLLLRLHDKSYDFQFVHIDMKSGKSEIYDAGSGTCSKPIESKR